MACSIELDIHSVKVKLTDIGDEINYLKYSENFGFLSAIYGRRQVLEGKKDYKEDIVAYYKQFNRKKGFDPYATILNYLKNEGFDNAEYTLRDIIRRIVRRMNMRKR